MAQLETGFYSTMQGPDLGKIGEGFERGLRIGDMMKQRKVQEARQPLEDQKMLLEKQRTQAGLIANAARNSKDQASYTNNILGLKQAGVDLTGVPDIYDPGMVQQYEAMALTAQERAENELKTKHYANEEKNRQLDRGINYSKLDLEKQKLELEKQRALTDIANPKLTDGQKALDKDFGQDANAFTSGGGSRLGSEITKIKDVVARMKAGKGTTGGMTGMLSDRLTSDEVLKNRADVQQSAMTLIKTLLSGATSDKDREAIVNTLWNEADSTENNVARLERFASDMQSKLDETSDKVKFFENSKGTLSGYKSQGPVPIKKEDMPPKPQTIIQNGFIYKLNPQTGEYE